MTDSFTHDSTNNWSTPILYTYFSIRLMTTILCLGSWDSISELWLEVILDQSYQQKAPNLRWSGIDHSTEYTCLWYGNWNNNFKICCINKSKQFHMPIKSGHTHLCIDTQILPSSASTGNVHAEALVSEVWTSFNDQANSQVQHLGRCTSLHALSGCSGLLVQSLWSSGHKCPLELWVPCHLHTTGIWICHVEERQVSFETSGS